MSEIKYRISTEEKTWSEAKAFCEANNEKLATLLSDAEFEEINKLIKDLKYYWIGGFCSGNSCEVTTGIYEILVQQSPPIATLFLGFLAIVELNLVPFALVSLIFHPCCSKLLF